jgi:pimeloyl-ACP methyl ester carboxylesterase
MPRSVTWRWLGDSSKPLTGYDKKTVAEDIYELVRNLGHRRIFLVGHDHGAAVASAYAAAHREDVRFLVFLEIGLMGGSGWRN